MIVCSVQPYYRYSGLSTDEKPTKNIQDAATFWETDSGKEFEWREDDWYEKIFESNRAVVLYVDGSILYLCTAAAGIARTAPKWKVKKIDTTSGVVVTWCDGNALYDNVATSLDVVKAFNYS